METMEATKKIIHEGRNVARIRRSKDMKQTTLADLTGLSQQSVSDYERKEKIEEPVLKKFAAALNCSVELLKTMEADPLTVIIENNSIETNNGTANGYNAGDIIVNNPVDKIVELCEKLLAKDEEKIALLERLLKEKK